MLMKGEWLHKSIKSFFLFFWYYCSPFLSHTFWIYGVITKVVG